MQVDLAHASVYSSFSSLRVYVYWVLGVWGGVASVGVGVGEGVGVGAGVGVSVGVVGLSVGHTRA